AGGSGCRLRIRICELGTTAPMAALRPVIESSAVPTAIPMQMDSAELSQLLTMTTVCADTVKLKLTIPDSDDRPTIRALGIDPFEAKVRQLVYFDTPSLDLDRLSV